MRLLLGLAALVSGLASSLARCKQTRHRQSVGGQQAFFLVLTFDNTVQINRRVKRCFATVNTGKRPFGVCLVLEDVNSRCQQGGSLAGVLGFFVLLARQCCVDSSVFCS